MESNTRTDLWLEVLADHTTRIQHLIKKLRQQDKGESIDRKYAKGLYHSSEKLNEVINFLEDQRK